jgi:hypothetical protein
MRYVLRPSNEIIVLRLFTIVDMITPFVIKFLGRILGRTCGRTCLSVSGVAGRDDLDEDDEGFGCEIVT